METPEQKTPDVPIPAPWEACYTLGGQWQFRPTNENYKSAKNVISKLIEIRAKGGNLLLNFGPDEKGDFAPEQKGILNELSLWMFINGEAFENTEAQNPIKEGGLWFLKHKEKPIIYAFAIEDDWKYRTRKEYLLKFIKADKNTKISVLGHGGKILEYRPEIDPKVEFKNTDEGLKLSVMRAQRIYNDKKWPNPIVIKIEL